MQTGVIVLFHGSRAGDAEAAARRLCEDVERQVGQGMVEPAYLQHARPGLADVVDALVRRGAGRVIIVPFFVLPGAHVAGDIPELIEKARKEHPGTEFIVTDHVGAHPMMAKIVAELVGKSNAECPASGTGSVRSAE